MASELGLPRTTFAKLSPHPYLLANLEPSDKGIPPARSNGRAPHVARPPSVNSSSLSHAHGSALVRVGDTTVICGVRGETLLAADIPNYRASNRDRELLDYDLLVPNIELATGCAPQFLPGVPPTTLAQTLSTRVFSLLHSTKLVRPEHLRICHTQPSERAGHEEEDGQERMDEDEHDAEDEEAESIVVAYWVLYIDIFFISFDGNPFDAAWAAMVAALRDTKLPQARWDADREMILCSREEKIPLVISGLPIACTAVVFTQRDTYRPGDGKYWLLLDPDRLEESLCDEAITVVVDASGEETRVLGMSKNGGTDTGPELLRGLVPVAARRWMEFRKAMISSS